MGLGYDHDRTRKALLPYAYGKVCPYHGKVPTCPGVMRRGQLLDLDHSTPRSRGGQGAGDRMAHAACNRSWGNGTRGDRTDPGPTPGW